MSLDTLNNGDSGLDARTKINAAIAAASGLPRNHVSGLTMGGGNSVLYVYAGTCRDDSNSVDMTMAFTLAKYVSSSWAAGYNSGVVESGTTLAANTCYAVWLIKNAVSDSLDVLISASATSPTMPSGYTYKRRIGWMRATSSTSIAPFYQQIDEVILNTNQTSADFSATLSTSTAAVPLFAPPAVSVLLKASASSTSSAFYVTLDRAQIFMQPPTAETASLRGVAATAPAAGHFTLPTDSSSQIYVRASGTSVTLKLTVRGWIDSRGRYD